MSNKIVERIQKLMALAEGSEGNEAETAARMARRLMAEHGVTAGDLQDMIANGVDGKAIIDVSFALDGLKLNSDSTKFKYFGSRTPWWKRNLFFRLVAYLDMKGSYRRGSNVVNLYAFKSDVEVLEYLYEICAAQIDAAAKAFIKINRVFTGARHGKSVGTEFRESAVLGLAAKLEDLKRMDKEELGNAGTALVVTKRQAITDWVAAHVALRDGPKRKRPQHSRAGYSAGQRVRLNAGVGVRSSRSLEG